MLKLRENESDREHQTVDEVDWVEDIDVYEVHDGHGRPEDWPHPVEPTRWRCAG